MKPTRRRFLRGASACLALPWLEGCTAPAPTSAPTPTAPPVPPTRLCILVMPNGVLQSAWTPKSDGHGGYQPSFSLEPLGLYQDRVSVLTGLCNRNSFDGDGHYAKVAPLLTGQKIKRTGARELWNGESMDQLAARQLGSRTLLPSIELGCDPIYPVEDLGYSTVYGGTIAWRAPDRPCTKEIVPQKVFDRLFGCQALADDPARQSVLDVVKADADALRHQLGRRDQDKLAEYLDSVRALELRIAAARTAQPVAAATTAPPPGVPADYTTHLALMFDLLALAFTTDTTRIATFLLANEVSQRDFGFVEGCAGSFHEFSHHEGKREKQEPYGKINRWHVGQFARFLQRLDVESTNGERLLDRTMVVLASGMSDGNSHSPHDLPVLLAGGARCGLPQGRLLAHAKDTPLCGLWLSLLQRFGVAADRFGDASAPLV